MDLTRLPLPALLAQWARTADRVERGDVPPAEFPEDVAVRHEIAQRLRNRPTTMETREMLAEVDETFRQGTVAVEACSVGAERAAAEGWTSAREWYLWRQLKESRS
jgi:hypothetical protein